jgi:hypothetical protein
MEYSLGEEFVVHSVLWQIRIEPCGPNVFLCKSVPVTENTFPLRLRHAYTSNIALVLPMLIAAP